MALLVAAIWWAWWGIGAAPNPMTATQPAAPLTPPVSATPTPLSVDQPHATAPVLASSRPQATLTVPVPRHAALAKPTAAQPAPELGAPRKWAAMTDAERQQWPRLQLGGSMYSEDKSARMLVVNDQVVREGAEVSAGLTLEQIGPRAATFSFRGQRVQLDY